MDKELRRLQDEAVERAKARLESAAESTEVRLGSIYLFGNISVNFEWVIVRQHKDDVALWYAVASDDCQLAGSADVTVPSVAGGAAMTLRCGRGTWIHEDDLRQGKCIGNVDERIVEDAADRLACLVRGGFIAAPEAIETDADPDYHELMDELDVVIAEMDGHFKSEPVVVAFSEFENHQLSDSREFALAAASDAGVDEEQMPAGRELKSSLPGKLTAIRYPAEATVFLAYTPADSEAPSRLTEVCGLDVSGGEWQLNSDGRYVWSQELPVLDGVCQFSIAGGKFKLA